ncbi:hypothetical protein CW748_09290 [Alteromonadales bacterium alter-6D02]|nr:hypothetical protein CW748_09290 [Alteromonadales bacterium alter-6D02]
MVTLITAVVCFGLIICSLSLWQVNRATEQLINNHLNNLVHDSQWTINHFLSRQLMSQKQFVNAVSAAEPRYTPHVFKTWLAQQSVNKTDIQSKYTPSVAIFDHSGVAISQQNYPVNFINQQQMMAQAAINKPHIELLYSESDDAYLIHFIHAITFANNELGVVTFLRPLASLNEMVAEKVVDHSYFPIDVYFAHVDTFVPIAVSSEQQQIKALALSPYQLIVNSSAKLITTQDQNNNVLYAKAKLLKPFDITVVVTLLQEQVFGLIYSYSLVLIVTALILFIIVSTVFHHFIEKMMQPVTTLVHSSEALSLGNVNVKAEVDSNDEFKILATSLNQIGNKLSALMTLEQLKQQDILNYLTEAVVITNPEGVIIFANKAAAAMFGDDEFGLLGQRLNSFLLSAQSKALPDNEALQWQDLLGREVEVKRKDGSLFLANITVTSITLEQSIQCVAVIKDVTETFKREKELKRLALHDALTSLPTRRLLHERMEVAISRANRKETSFVILFLDLDNFKRINDDHGHSIGDTVLITVAERLKNTVRDVDTVTRFGGDEFIVLAEDIDTRFDTLSLVNKIKANVAKPMVIDFQALEIGVSIGIATYPYDGSTIEELIRKSDEDMYHNKRTAS